MNSKILINKYPLFKPNYIYMLRRVSLFYLVIFFIFLIIPSPISAQVTESNCVITKVGDPSSAPPNCSGNLGSDNPLIKAGEDIKTAYDDCGQPSGYTWEDVPNLDNCLRGELSSHGYSDSQVDAFFRRKTYASIAHGSGKCVECIGYVALAISLYEGISDGVLNYPCAAAVNTLPNGFTIGVGTNRISYNKIGEGNSAPIQEGDIAVKGNGCEYDWRGYMIDAGHILFVKTINPDNPVFFTGLESNYGLDCKITDDKSWSKQVFTFYRRNG